MGLVVPARVLGYDGCNMLVMPQQSIGREMIKKHVDMVDIMLYDGRELSPDQRDKIFAIMQEISDWSGHDREDLRKYFTQNFCDDNGIDYFSLSPKKPNVVDMTTAKDFITYLIEFCFAWNVPTLDTMLNRAEEVGKYLYMCLEYRKCAICNSPADVHHIDAIGMGRDRDTIVHIGMKAIALCRKHHTEAHQIGRSEFMRRYHVFGIGLDEYLCKVLNLGQKTVFDERFERDKQFLQLYEDL